MSVSVVVTTYKKGKLLANTLAAVLDQIHVDDELIVVDDGGQDEPVVARFDGPRLSYHSQPDEGYRLASATNWGVQLASHPYVIKFDADSYPTGGCLDILRSQMKPNTLLDGRIEWEPRNKGSRARDHRFNYQTGELQDKFRSFNGTDIPQWCNVLWTGCVAFDREAFMRLGGISTRYDGAWGKDEVSLGHKWFFAGYDVRFVFDALAIHQGHAPDPSKQDQASNAAELKREIGELKRGIFPEPLPEPEGIVA